MILILASSIYEVDPQIELLVRNLEEQSVDFILINPFKHEDLGKIQVAYKDGSNKVFYDGKEIVITKVYVARHFRTDCIIDVPENCECTTLYRQKVDTFLNELCAVLTEAEWFPGLMDNLSKGDLKCYLYKLAHESGLIVPDETVNSFIQPNNLSYQKTLGPPFTITYDTESKGEIAITLKNEVVVEPETDGLPWQWQSQVKPDLQVRCVIVGDRVWSFSASEDQFQGKSLREYQMDNDVEWKEYKLPENIQSSLITLMKKFNLQFSCPEFLVGSKGTHYFIDLNPCGDWYGFGSESDSEEIANEIVTKLRV